MLNKTSVRLMALFIVCVFVFSYNYISQVNEAKTKRATLRQKIQVDYLAEMGITPDCDDGKTNLTIDWDYSPTAYTCLGNAMLMDPSITSKEYCEIIPENYKAEQVCMSEIILYSEPLPTYGMHRPVPPAYGEYKYLPVQRWLNSLEHGAIFALYHPCADLLEVRTLKRIVKKCSKRYIISPNNRLDEERPVALLSRGCKLSMSFINQSLAKKFIRQHARHGPEVLWDNGVFDDQLINKSQVASGYDDVDLCPENNGAYDIV